jgi:glycosyltransferase involved in cell wall biosynthesis
MKVLHIVSYAPVGGVENYTRNLFAELEAQGHENVVFSAGTKLPELEAPGRTVVATPDIVNSSDGGIPTRVQDLEQLLDRHPADVVFVHTGIHHRLADIITRRLPTVWFAHNYGSFCPAGALFYARTGAICEIENTPNWRCLVNAYAKQCNTRHPRRLAMMYRNGVRNFDWIGNVNGLVCDSEYVAQRHARAGFSRELIAVLPSPVLLPEQSTLPQSSAENRKLLFAGRLVVHKGLQVLLTALATVRQPWTLKVAGDGHDGSRLQDLCGQLKLTDHVEFLGRVDRGHMDDLYREAAVVVAPSVWPEPFGMVGPEAFSWGRPVVATAIAGMNEWLIDEKTGLAVKPGDAKHLAQQIQRLLDDPGLQTRLGTAGRELVKERFTFAAHVTRLLEVFQRAIDSHTAGVHLRA